MGFQNELRPAINAPKPVGPTVGLLPVGITGPEKFMNLGPARTRTEKIIEIPDRVGPGPNKLKIGPARTEINNFNRTRTLKIR